MIEKGGVKWSGEMMKLCDGNGGKVEKEPWQKAKVLGMKEDQGERDVYSDLGLGFGCFMAFLL